MKRKNSIKKTIDGIKNINSCTQNNGIVRNYYQKYKNK